MQVNENRLDTILQDFVETFNDCACCPLTLIAGETTRELIATSAPSN